MPRTNRILVWGSVGTVLFLVAAVAVVNVTRREVPLGGPSSEPATCRPFPLATADEYLRNVTPRRSYVPGSAVKNAAAFPFPRLFRTDTQYWAVAIDASVATVVVFHPAMSPDSFPNGMTFRADQTSERFLRFPPADGTTFSADMLKAGSEPAAGAARRCLTQVR